MGFSISPLGFSGGQKCPEKMGFSISSSSVFTKDSGLAAPHRVCTRKHGPPFHCWMFCKQVSPVKGSFPPNVTRTSLLCPKYMGSNLPSFLSKILSEHPAVCRGATSECSSCFGSLREGTRVSPLWSWRYESREDSACLSAKTVKSVCSAEEHSVCMSI